MKIIPLTQDKFASIDDEDYQIVSLFNWYAQKDYNTYYAITMMKICGVKTYISMHRLIMNAPKGDSVDHKSGNGLNNQKYNLRFCTHSQNQMNRRIGKNFSSKYKGVHWHIGNNKWHVNININKKIKWVGSFDSELKAAIAYNEVALRQYGEFANLNEI